MSKCDSRCVSLAEELLATVDGTRRSDIYELAAIIQTAFEDTANRIEEREGVPTFTDEEIEVGLWSQEQERRP